MGVKKDPKFKEMLSLRCPNEECKGTAVVGVLDHEDEDILKYEGKCVTCRHEYTIVVDKEPK